jgi:hypothetical protein
MILSSGFKASQPFKLLSISKLFDSNAGDSNRKVLIDVAERPTSQVHSPLRRWNKATTQTGKALTCLADHEAACEPEQSCHHRLSKQHQ